MKKYQNIQKKEILIEMATMGRIKDIVIRVYTDHNPPHFHVIKKDEYDVRITIKNQKILSYEWQKDGIEMSAKEYKNLLDWLDQPNKKNKKISNLEAISIVWNALD